MRRGVILLRGMRLNTLTVTSNKIR